MSYFRHVYQHHSRNLTLKKPKNQKSEHLPNANANVKKKKKTPKPVIVVVPLVSRPKPVRPILTLSRKK